MLRASACQTRIIKRGPTVRSDMKSPVLPGGASHRAMSHKQSTVQARLVLLALILLLLIAACRNQPNGQGSDNNATATGQGIVQERPDRTPPPSLTPLPSSTPTPTLTPTIAPTPTPTAPPITLGGNPLALASWL